MSTAAGGAVCLALLALLPGCASRAFFYPDRGPGIPPPAGVRDVRFASADGTALHGWFAPAVGPATATVVHFHGNAGNLAHHWPFVAWLPHAGYNVFAFDYRGYGRSAGQPSVGGAVADGLAALEQARALDPANAHRLLVFGQSLGGALALAAVGESQPPGVRGLAIDSAFSAYTRIAREKLEAGGLAFPFSAVTYLLLADLHNPGDAAAHLSPRPLLLLHGGGDTIVPVSHGQRLLALAAPPKELHVFPDAEHLRAWTENPAACRRLLLEFFARCLADASP